jgi:hypothetical protein
MKASHIRVNTQYKIHAELCMSQLIVHLSVNTIINNFPAFEQMTWVTIYRMCIRIIVDSACKFPVTLVKKNR